MPLVVYLARRFSGRNEPMNDLVQVGAIGLIKAIDRFDPERAAGVLHLRDADDPRRDQAALPRHRLADPRARAARRSCRPRSTPRAPT